MKNKSKGIALQQIRVTDHFWKYYMELVRREVLPYQWNALNDKEPGAAPSYSVRNLKLAGKLTRQRKEQGMGSTPIWPVDTFETLPDSPEKMEEKFYGFLFQDSDLYKWIEAVGYSLTQTPDPELEAAADTAIELVCASQQEDGYVNSFYTVNDLSQRFTNLRDNHELYCFGHMVEAAAAYYQATGKDALLKTAERFADCIYGRFGRDEGKSKGYPGHEEAELALVRLYEVSGEKKYLELAEFFLEERGTNPHYFDKEQGHTPDGPDEGRYVHQQAHCPVKEQKEAVGHAVRAVYLYCGMADAAGITQDTEMLKACETLWNSIVRNKMYITGGIGATHLGEAFSFPYDLPNDTAYTETCAAIGLVFFARRMLENHPKAEYADIMERALYNGVLSGMALDGKSFFYVNPLEVLPEACRKDERKKHVALPRQKWFGCACCPPNLARIIGSVAQYAYSENDEVLFQHLYVGGEWKKVFHDTEVSFRVNSSYPWKDKVVTEISPELPVTFTYAVRIPGWCPGHSLSVNGEPSGAVIEDGYAYIAREWKQGDTVELTLPMQPIFYRANPLVREDIGKVALMRGPVVYCLEEADNGRNLHSIRVSHKAEPKEDYMPELLGGIVEISCTGKKIKEHDWESAPLYVPAGEMEEETVNLTWIPYYAWDNRGAGEMTVWVREIAE